MESTTNLMKKLVLAVILLTFAGLLGLATALADQPLSKDDVTLLLLGSSPNDRIIQMVEQRGIDFQMNPDLAKKFHDLGASDALIDALQKAGQKAAPPTASAQAPAAEGKPNVPGAQVPPSSEAVSQTQPAAPPTVSAPSAAPQTAEGTKPAAAAPAKAVSDITVERKIQEILAGLASSPGTGEPGMEKPQAPTLRIQDITGRRLAPEDFKDKVVLVNFWATWCPYCKSEIPELVRLERTYREQGFEVMGIAVEDSAGRVKSFAKQSQINYTVAMGDETMKRIYGGVKGLPTSFLIGRDGRIYQKIIGAPMDATIFERTIKMLLKAPAAGRTMVAQAAGPAAPAPASPPPAAPQAAPSSEPVLHVRQTTTEAAPAAASAPPPAAPANPAAGSAPALKDPSSEEIQHIIQEFAAKEKIFREARNNYTYHQINKVQELGPDNEVVGTYEQQWDILYDDSGKRIERVTYAPEPSLKNLIVTQEDIENFRNIQPFVLTTDELPEYEIKYLGHVKVDEITAYVFSVRPKEIQKNHLYFQGVVWVDDRDLQIVKSEGKTVPELKGKRGQNLFPRFTTWREQIDGKFWFPTFTLADDTLYFPNSPPVHIKEIVRYTDYKQFKSGVRILTVESMDKQKDTTTAAPAAPNK
jgi:thiol-disulfide isomerase/thioredoxin